MNQQKEKRFRYFRYFNSTAIFRWDSVLYRMTIMLGPEDEMKTVRGCVTNLTRAVHQGKAEELGDKPINSEAQ